MNLAVYTYQPYILFAFDNFILQDGVLFYGCYFSLHYSKNIFLLKCRNGTIVEYILGKCIQFDESDKRENRISKRVTKSGETNKALIPATTAIIVGVGLCTFTNGKIFFMYIYIKLKKEYVSNFKN